MFVAASCRILRLGGSARQRAMEAHLVIASHSDRWGTLARRKSSSRRLISRHSLRLRRARLNEVSPGGNGVEHTDQALNQKRNQQLALEPCLGGDIVVLLQVSEENQRLEALEVELDLPSQAIDAQYARGAEHLIEGAHILSPRAFPAAPAHAAFASHPLLRLFGRDRALLHRAQASGHEAFARAHRHWQSPASALPSWRKCANTSKGWPWCPANGKVTKLQRISTSASRSTTWQIPMGWAYPRSAIRMSPRSLR